MKPVRKPGLPLGAVAALLAVLFLSACSNAAVNTATRDAGQETARITDAERAFADTLQRRTFDFFWEQADPVTGLMPDRWPTKSFISVGATGFALTAYPIGAEHRWITRDQAATRTLRTLEFLWNARQDTAYAGSSGYKGFFYHFLNPGSGTRFEDVELSNADTGLLFFGALFCQSYFDKGNTTERQIRHLTDSLVARADWHWMQVRPPVLSLGWKPREGHLPYDWRGYNETMFMHVLALASTTHPLTGDTWRAWTDGYQWGRFHDQEYLGFAPLFGHQFSHVWIDFRGIQDEFMRGKGIDYFENSRRATLAQRAYAVANPSKFRDYSEDIWASRPAMGPWTASSRSMGWNASSTPTTPAVPASRTLWTTARSRPRPPAVRSRSHPRCASPRCMRCAPATASTCTASTGSSTRSTPRCTRPRTPIMARSCRGWAGSTTTTSASTRARSSRCSRTGGAGSCGASCATTST